MAEDNKTKDNTILCEVCGTPLIHSKKDIDYENGSLVCDGSFTFGNDICPKCHPEYADQ